MNNGSPESERGYDAEQCVKLWLGRAGVVCTPPDRDQNGWDFLAEVPLFRTDAHLDAASDTFKCLIQVKAVTGDETTTRDMKLSNWRSLALDPMPVFFVVVQYPGDLSPQEPNCWRLIHLGKELIDRVLKRLNMAEGKGGENLHKSTMTLNWSNHDPVQVAEHTGDAIRDAITCEVGDPSDYRARKKHLQETLGYDSRPTTIKFETSVSDKELAMWAVGKRDSIPFEDMRESTVRYDIERPTSLATGKGVVRLDVESPPVEAKVRFTDPDQGRVVELSTVMRASRSIVRVNREHELFRFTSSTFELLIGGGRAHFSFTVEPEAGPLRMNEVGPTTEAVQLMEDAVDEVVIEVTSSGLGAPINSTMSTDGFTADEHFNHVRNAWVVVRHFGMERVDGIDIDLCRGQRRTAETMASAIEGVEVNAKFTSIEKADPGRSLTVVFCAVLHLGSFVFVMTFGLDGPKPVFMNDGTASWASGGSLDSLNKWQCTSSDFDRWSLDQWPEYQESTKRRYLERGRQILFYPVDSSSSALKVLAGA